MKATWCEVWIDTDLEPPYVLVVSPTDKGTVVVFDPRSDSITHEGPDYESVKLWLLEDEYSRVDGRIIQE